MRIIAPAALLGLAALGLTAAASAAPTTPPAAAPPPLFRADFGIYPLDGPAEYWEVQSGDWVMVDGTPHAYRGTPAGATPAVTLIGADMTDGSVRAAIQAAPGAAPSLLFRWSDARDYERAGYDPAAGAWRVWRCTGGTETALATGPKVAALDAKPHVLLATFRGDTLTLSVDGKTQCRGQDPASDAKSRHGEAGLQTDGGPCRVTGFVLAAPPADTPAPANP